MGTRPDPSSTATLHELLERIIQVRGGVIGGFDMLSEKADEMARLAAEAILLVQSAERRGPPDAGAFDGNADGLTDLLAEINRWKAIAERQMNDAEEARIEIAELKQRLATSSTGATDWHGLYMGMSAVAEEQEKRANAIQAQLDRVMLEYCPDEMTPEQIENWKRHQRPVSAEQEAALNKAIQSTTGTTKT